MNISINGNTKQLDGENMTISDLMVTLNLVDKRLAIEKNGEIVPRSQFEIGRASCRERVLWVTGVQTCALPILFL